MADPGTFYCSYEDVKNILNEQSIGAAGSTLYSEASLLLACTMAQAKIHLKLGIRTITKISDAIYKEILKGIQVDLIMMRILQGRILNENNISDPSAITGYWSIMPALTYEHLKILNEILDERDGVSWTFDTRSGSEVTN